MRFRKKGWVLNSSIWRAVLSLFYPPVIIRGKNGKNSENPVGSNKSEKRKPKSAVYRSFWASVVYFHLRLISTKSHKREMTRNQVVRKGTWVRIPPAPPKRKTSSLDDVFLFGFRRLWRLYPSAFYLHGRIHSARHQGLHGLFWRRMGQKQIGSWGLICSGCGSKTGRSAQGLAGFDGLGV